MAVRESARGTSGAGDRRLRVLMVVGALHADETAAGFVVDFVRELASRVDALEVIALKGAAVDVGENVTVHYVRGSWKAARLQSLSRLILAGIRDHGADVVFSHMNEELAVVAGIWARLTNTPHFHWYCSVYGTSWFPSDTHGPWKYRVALLFPRNILTCSEVVKERYINHFNIPSEKIEVIYHGIRFSAFELHRKRSTSKGHGPQILTVGRISRVKDVETLVKAMCHVQERFPDASLRIVGGPSSFQDSIEYYEGIKALVKRLGLEGSVIFEGSVANRDTPVFYHSSDLCVFGGIVFKTVLEAVAAERPIITQRETLELVFPDIPEDVKRRLSYTRGDDEELAERMCALLADSGLRTDLARHLRLRAKDRYDLPVYVERIMAAFRRAVFLQPLQPIVGTS